MASPVLTRAVWIEGQCGARDHRVATSPGVGPLIFPLEPHLNIKGVNAKGNARTNRETSLTIGS